MNFISFNPIETTVVNHHQEFNIRQGHILKGAKIQCTEVTCGDPNFAPKLWCDRQWVWLTSSISSDNMGFEILKRGLMLIPLLFASIIAYPMSCCIFSVETTDDLGSSQINAAGFQTTKTLFLPASCTKVIFDSPGILHIKIQNTNDENLEIANQIALEATYDENLDSTFNASYNEEGCISISQKKDCLSSKPNYTLSMPSLTKLHVKSVGSVNIDSNITANIFTLTQNSTGKVIINTINVNELQYKNNGSGSTFINQINTDGIFHCTSNGSGKISINDIHVETFNCDINDSGKVNFKTGFITDSNISLAGSGSYFGSDINAVATHIKITGSGKAYLDKEPITQTITGSGKYIVGSQKC